jgi:hypothetical protein
MNNSSWRSIFIELCEAIFRDMGFDPPTMLHDDNLPLAMELEVNQRAFELVHTAGDRPERILVICKLGAMPEDADSEHYAALLEANLRNARNFRPCFGTNADSGEVVWVGYEGLENLRAGVMLEKLRELAGDADHWKENIFDSMHSDFAISIDLPGAKLA